jgi:hypothetical protein
MRVYIGTRRQSSTQRIHLFLLPLCCVATAFPIPSPMCHRRRESMSLKPRPPCVAAWGRGRIRFSRKCRHHYSLDVFFPLCRCMLIFFDGLLWLLFHRHSHCKDVYTFSIVRSNVSSITSTREFEFISNRSASVKSHTYDICCCSFPHCRN